MALAVVRSLERSGGCTAPRKRRTSSRSWSASGWPPASAISRGRGEVVRWNLRMKAAERGIWKATEMRGRLAEAGLEISHGKMSGLWTGTPITIRLDDLDVLCAVLDCSPAELLITEPDKVAARRSHKAETATASPPTPR